MAGSAQVHILFCQSYRPFLQTGFISRENLREMLGSNAEAEITDIIKSADTDADGQSKSSDMFLPFRSSSVC